MLPRLLWRDLYLTNIALHIAPCEGGAPEGGVTCILLQTMQVRVSGEILIRNIQLGELLGNFYVLGDQQVRSIS